MAQDLAALADGENAGPFDEIGVSGLKAASGYVYEEWLPALRGVAAYRTYRQMAENDATVGAILYAIGLVLRRSKWKAEPNPDAPKAQGEAEAEFAESLLVDMSHSFEDFIAECMSMLVYGWAYFETVFKRREGPLETDPTMRSNFNDGRIGIRKIAPRSQDSMQRWEMQEDGGISGLWQQPPMGGGIAFIPIERSLLFRTTSKKNNPEGQSILRTAYTSYFRLNRINESEVVGIERNLAGLPVMKIPMKYLGANVDANDRLFLDACRRIVRDVRLNQQGGIIIPSDAFVDKDNNPSAVPIVTFELVKGSPGSAVDVKSAKEACKQEIVNSVMAGFILLGNESKGSYALSKDKTDFFLMACEAILDQMAGVMNRHMLPRVWDLNGLDRALMPTFKPGALSPVDLSVLGAFLQAVSAAGATLFPDEDLEAKIRDDADLPPKSAEALAAQQEEQATAAEAARVALETARANVGAAPGKPGKPGGAQPKGAPGARV